jgi:hypothetical protein
MDSKGHRTGYRGRGRSGVENIIRGVFAACGVSGGVWGHPGGSFKPAELLRGVER